MKTDYTKRLTLPLINDDPFLTLYSTPSYIPVAQGYTSIVIGERGPYMEFLKSQIYWEHFYIPNNCLWKIGNKDVYYAEYRSIKDSTKLYLQYKEVDYAAYKINRCYLSPFDLSFYSYSLKCYQKVIEKLRP